jgi:HAMP domain-containing protein
MRSSTLSRRILRGVLLLFVPPTVLAGGILAFLYSLDVHHHPVALLATVLTGAVAMVASLAFMVHGMGESLVETLREIQFGAELMATVNPEHRLQIQTGDELEALAREINRIADCLGAACAGSAAAAAKAAQELSAECGMLGGAGGAGGRGGGYHGRGPGEPGQPRRTATGGPGWAPAPGSGSHRTDEG